MSQSMRGNPEPPADALGEKEKKKNLMNETPDSTDSVASEETSGHPLGEKVEVETSADCIVIDPRGLGSYFADHRFPASDPKYVKHVICEGARFHVISYSQEGRKCSEPDCIINKPSPQSTSSTRTSEGHSAPKAGSVSSTKPGEGPKPDPCSHCGHDSGGHLNGTGRCIQCRCERFLPNRASSSIHKSAGLKP